MATARRKPTPKKKAAPRAAAESLAPDTGKAEPGEHTRPMTFLPAPRVGGVRVTEETALTLATVWACVKVISEDIAGLPWRVMERRAGGGSDPRPEDPADWLLHTQASPETPAFQFREAIVAHALTWGNGYAEIERDVAGRPAWLWLLTPDRVCPMRADDGRIVYEVRNPRAAPTHLELDDVFHLKGLGFDGLVGYSVVQFAARSIGAGIALDQATSEFFGNDSTPGGVLEHPGKMSKEASDRLMRDWERRHAGPNNRRKVAVLEEGMTWKQTGLPPEDAKLIEQRQFTPAEICRWFRVSPVKVQDLLRATFSNIEELAIWHVTDTLLPWVRRLETEANIKMFGRTNRGRRFTRLNLKGLLRGDTAAQTEHVARMLGLGVYDINEARDYLGDLNPIGGDGTKRFVPVNMQLLEKAGEDPPAAAPSPAAPAAPAGKAAAMGAALRPVFEDACRRLLRAEAERAKSAILKGPEGVAAMLEKVNADHAEYVRRVLGPATAALALAGGVNPDRMDAAVGVVAGRHVEGLRERLAAATAESAAAWEGLAGETAGRLVEQLSAALECAA